MDCFAIVDFSFTGGYQSFRLSLAVLSTVPAVIAGSLGALLLTGSTLNLQSYMGMIMSTGVSVANAILIVTNAEKLRLQYRDADKASVMSAVIRMRPILMTSFAMMPEFSVSAWEKRRTGSTIRAAVTV